MRGELAGRESDVKFDQIHDALPLKDWADWLSKFAALAIVDPASRYRSRREGRASGRRLFPS
jgi:hypothetical protein